MNIACPKCAAKFKSDKVRAGMSVKCPRCTIIFGVPDEIPTLPVVSPPAGAFTAQAPQPMAAIAAGQPMPAGMQPHAGTTQPRYPEPEPTSSNAGMVALIIGGALVLLLLLAGGGAAAVIFLVNRSAETPANQIAQNNNNPADVDFPQPPPDNGGIPPINPVPPGGGGIVPPTPVDKNQPDPRTPPKDNGGAGGRLGQFQVDFLTSTAKGSRFVIIADHSSSMTARINRRYDPDLKQFVFDNRQHSAIDLLKDELVRTIQKFKPGSKYYISFFNSRTTPMPFGDTWVEGGQNEAAVTNWVNSIRPTGGTSPYPAFQKAFSLNPPPDVIFFMTDGQFSRTTAAQVANLNRDKKTIINTIQFNVRARSTTIRTPGRYYRLLERYQFPADVETQLTIFAKKFGRPPINNLPPRANMYDQQMQAIATQNGGKFTLFDATGQSDQNNKQPAGKGKLKPLLAGIGQITKIDPKCPYRRTSHCKIHTVMLKAGVRYQIDMISNYDNYLFVGTPNGQRLASDDDGGESVNAMLSFTPPQDGVYLIYATGYSSSGIGPYLLTLIDNPV